MSVKKYAWDGTIYFAPCTSAGVATGGYERVGNAYPMTMKVTKSEIDEISAMHLNPGLVIESWGRITEIMANLSLRYFNAQSLAYALSATCTLMTGTSGTVSAAEEVVSLPIGQFASLAHKKISSVVVKDHATGLVTYSGTTDYELDVDLGMIALITGTTITPGATLDITYSYGADTGYQLVLGGSRDNFVKIKGNMRNSHDSTTVMTLELDCVKLNPSQDTVLISDPTKDDPEELQFDMKLITLSGQSSPGRINGVMI